MSSILYDFIEVFLKRNFKKDNNFIEANDFFKRKYNVKKFNLDEESLFMEFEYKKLDDGTSQREGVSFATSTDVRGHFRLRFYFAFFTVVE